MKISFDGMIMQLQPDAVAWEPPRLIARDGVYSPIAGQYWSCRLSLGKTVVPFLHDWQTLYCMSFGISHTAILPNPFTGAMTSYSCYVDSVTPRMDTSDQSDHCAALAGYDIILSGIIVC